MARKLPVHRRRRRPPFFAPAALRARCDGWTVERQCGFLAQLYLTGSVAAAARAVGMSRASAYRLRARAEAEGFARAWDHVLPPPIAGDAAGAGAGEGPGPGGKAGAQHRAGARRDWRKVTHEALVRQVESGLVQPVLYRGTFRAIREKPDNSALLRLLRRADGRAARGGAGGALASGQVFEPGAVGVTPDAPGGRKPLPPGAPGNGTNHAAGLTAAAICGPSRRTER